MVPGIDGLSGLERALSSATLVLLAALGCVEPHGDSAPTPPPVADVEIDAGGALELDPGAGVGVAIAYDGAGRWQLTTACDTVQTHEVCEFDVLVSSDASGEELSDGEGVDLEAEDELSAPDPFALELQTVTDDDLDGMTFSASPGATVRVSVLFYDPQIDSQFNWTDDPRMLSWVGHGAVNWGAPTNPIDLTPDQP